MPSESIATPARRAPASLHARTTVALIILLVDTAWVVLAGWSVSPWRRWLDHGAWADLAWLAALCRSIPEGERIGPAASYAFAWLLMIAAMMLPTTLPLLTLFRRIVGSRSDGGTLVATVAVGYAAAWLLFGLVAYGIDVVVRDLAARSGWLVAHGWVVGSVVIAGAGAFQFSSLKYRCLERCRTPFGFVNTHWRGRRPLPEALRLGFDHGIFCVGCCWALMLVTFVVGMGNIGWMLVLAAAMAAEKNARWGARLRTPLGVALIVWGVAIAVSQV